MTNNTTPFDYATMFDVLNDKGQHKIFCCPAIGEINPDYNYVGKTRPTEPGFLKAEIGYFVARRCGLSDGNEYPDTLDNQPYSDLNSDYCFCAFEVMVSRDGASHVDSAPVTRYYAIYKSKFIRPPHTRPDGKRGGIVKDIDGIKFEQAKAFELDLEWFEKDPRDGWGLRPREERSRGEIVRHKYRLAFTAEGNWKCNGHGLSFTIKLHQWEAGPGAPPHTNMTLVDILGEPLRNPYRPGLELKLPVTIVTQLDTVTQSDTIT